MEPTPAPRKAPKLLTLFIIVFSASLLAMSTFGIGAITLVGDSFGGGGTDAESWSPSMGCNVVGIAVHGDISITPYSYSPEECAEGCPSGTYSDDVIQYLHTAREDDSILAVLLDVSSYGGEPVASEEIAEAVKNTEKPSVAWIRQSGTSGAYWIASAADTIIASANSDVGSIGITMSYLDNVNKNNQEGLTYNSLSSGKYKDAGNPDRALTEEEVDLFRRDLAIIHANFIAAVAENRALPLEQVAALADGSSMLGAMAIENGLVDAIGGQKEAYAALEEKIGEEPVVCWGGL